MRNLVAGLGAALALAACAGGVLPDIAMFSPQPAAVSANAPHILAAVADERRPQANVARDVQRHPAEILAFAGVQPGWRVADVGPGGGYYTRLLAVAVGERGRVYAIERPNPPDRERAILAVAPSYPNVTVVQQGYQNWDGVPEPLDAIFISQIYHDFRLLELDVGQLNARMFAALRPGGALIVIDHSAAPGSAPDVYSTHHRIEQNQVVRELQEAGFVLEAESQVLRNPADDRSLRVFENDIRGQTDQFVLRFRKPR